MTNKLMKKLDGHKELIVRAISGNVDLRDNYKLYNKIYRYYTKSGVTFTGDTQTDYSMIINYLYEDISY